MDTIVSSSLLQQDDEFALHWPLLQEKLCPKQRPNITLAFVILFPLARYELRTFLVNDNNTTTITPKRSTTPETNPYWFSTKVQRSINIMIFHESHHTWYKPFSMVILMVPWSTTNQWMLLVPTSLCIRVFGSVVTIKLPMAYDNPSIATTGTTLPTTGLWEPLSGCCLPNSKQKSWHHVEPLLPLDLLRRIITNIIGLTRALSPPFEIQWHIFFSVRVQWSRISNHCGTDVWRWHGTCCSTVPSDTL